MQMRSTILIPIKILQTTVVWITSTWTYKVDKVLFFEDSVFYLNLIGKNGSYYSCSSCVHFIHIEVNVIWTLRKTFDKHTTKETVHIFICPGHMYLLLRDRHTSYTLHCFQRT